MARSYDERMDSGRLAMKEGRWPDAYAQFAAALAIDDNPETREAVGDALWWSHDPATIEHRERAYKMHRQRGDKRSAARLATVLAVDYFEFRGESAVAQGWMQRARRLLEGDEECAEWGWLQVWDGHASLMIGNDANQAKECAVAAAIVARRLDLIDLEMLAISLEGLALVTAGEVDEGIRRLDEGTASIVSGEMSDGNAMATAICYMMDACDRIRDYDRAAQWCARAQELAPIIRMPEIMAVCRPHFAVVLMWRGDWQEAENQLLRSNKEIMTFRPLMVVEGIVRLAELRWRQGRWDEADTLFEQVKAADLSQLGRAELALSRGNTVEAIDLAQRYLRRIPSNDRIERGFGLEVAVRCLTAGRRLEDARAYADELADISGVVSTEPMLAAAALAAGLVAAAADDHEAARICFEDATDFFERHGAPFESARARVELACSLSALNRPDTAASEANLAVETFRKMGAAKELDRALSFLGNLDPLASHVVSPQNEAGLTGREAEVLRLVSSGRSNQEIADCLVLSVRTVERHISTIYEKLGVSGKAARVAATTYAHKHGLS